MLKDFLAQKKAAAQADVEAYAKAESDYEAELKAEKDKGFDEGVAHVGTIEDGDKLYSEQELQDELKPLKEKQAELEASLAEEKSLSEGMKAQVEGIPTMIADAKKAHGLEIAQKIKDASIDDLKIAEDLEKA